MLACRSWVEQGSSTHDEGRELDVVVLELADGEAEVDVVYLRHGDRCCQCVFRHVYLLSLLCGVGGLVRTR